MSFLHQSQQFHENDEGVIRDKKPYHIALDTLKFNPETLRRREPLRNEYGYGIWVAVMV